MVTTIAHAKNEQQNFKTHVVGQKISFLVASRVVLFNTSKKDNIIVVFTEGIKIFYHNIDKHKQEVPKDTIGTFFFS